MNTVYETTLAFKTCGGGGIWDPRPVEKTYTELVFFPLLGLERFNEYLYRYSGQSP